MSRPWASGALVALTSDPDGYFCAVEEGRIPGMVSALGRSGPAGPPHPDEGADAAEEQGELVGRGEGQRDQEA